MQIDVQKAEIQPDRQTKDDCPFYTQNLTKIMQYNLLQFEGDKQQ